MRSGGEEFCKGCPRDLRPAFEKARTIYLVDDPEQYWDIALWAMSGPAEDEIETPLEELAARQFELARRIHEADISWKPPK